MKIIQTGITRVVFLTKRHAIKVPRWHYGWANFIAGMYSNLSETQCWNATKSEHICPVLFSFAGLFVVMPRIKICETEDEIISIPDEDGIDRKPDNYGYYFNRIVCVDYPYHRIKSLNNPRQ